MARVKVLDQHVAKDFSLYHGDSVEVIRGLPNNSIDLTVTSPPFCNLYLYSPSARDMGNTDDDEHFFENFDYLIPELFRVTTPGRLAVIHCKDLPLFKGSDGVAGLRDFPGEIVRRFCGDGLDRLNIQIEALLDARKLLNDTSAIDGQIQNLKTQLKWKQEGSWVFHSRCTIWKCPKIEMERTNNHGLLHSQLCKDSSVSRQGMADYLLVFRKWSPEMDSMNSIKPVHRADGYRFEDYIGDEVPGYGYDQRGYSIKVWQKYASPVWSDIKQTDVLNGDLAKERKDERHICPLQLGVIARCIELWSNPGDVVFDPFNGIGSTGHQALKMARKYVGVELKRSYYETAIEYLTESANVEQLSLIA